MFLHILSSEKMNLMRLLLFVSLPNMVSAGSYLGKFEKVVELSAEDKKEIVNFYNKLRGSEGASDMLEMV